MSLLADAETALPAARGARLAIGAAVAIVALVLVAFAIWWLLVRPRAAHVAAATAKVEAATAASTAGAAQDAVKVITVHDREVDHIQTITEGGSHAVQSAADAGTPVPAVAAAMRGSLCLYDAYHGDAGCPAVPGAGAVVGAAQPDAGSAAAAR